MTKQERIVAKTVRQSEELPKGIKELKDGLTIERIKKDFPWILEAKIQDAVIGLKGKKLIWYDGTWKNGAWHNGYWYNGDWKKGTWYNGDWYNGTWEKGTWKGGTWESGAWLMGLDKDKNKHGEDDSPDKW